MPIDKYHDALLTPKETARYPLDSELLVDGPSGR